jgi:hypothetical protein
MNEVYDFVNYSKIFKLKFFDRIVLMDHLDGFDKDLHNEIIAHLDSIASVNNTVCTNYIVENSIKEIYTNLNFTFDHFDLHAQLNDYNIHPTIDFKNFICSFNGSNHVGRKLLVAILERFGYFNSEYCSKNGVFSVDQLDGHIRDYVGNQDNFYRKFFIADNSELFFNTVTSFGYVKYAHKNNIYNLESKLTGSFLHLVSETMATSYVPFVTEKFLYSVVTRGLFLSYAQPGWHAHLEKYYGFKQYTKLFDYRFDSIQNPVERLVELMSMVSKFSRLSTNDWHNLYELELETIEYNYNHYFSQNYLTHLRNHADYIRQ